jgi:hypothetical protein
VSVVRGHRVVPPTIVEAMADERLFGPWFKKKTWQAWFAFIAALFALPMSDEQLAIFKQCTGREAAPTAVAREAWLVCGRRSGKSFILALIAVYLATFRSYRQYLQPGERGTVIIIAGDKKQARVIFRFVRGLLKNVPMLRKMVERETADAFDLSNSTTIEIHVASFRSTRGYAVIAALLDEVAFWSIDGANPDKEVLAALRPAMAMIPGAMLLCASSPYAKRGVLWDAFKKHFGKDGPVMVWRAPTRVMNPLVPQATIDAAFERDPADASAEYMAEFRSDVESFIDRAVVEAATVPHRVVLPKCEGVGYVAFVDPSGGSSDSMTLAICHCEGERVVLDCALERKPPFSPDDVVREFAATIKSYGIASCQGDHYGGLWPRERFAVHGIDYVASSQTKSEIYLAMLPMLNSGRIELLDNVRLIAQLCSLERKTSRVGRDTVDHPPHQHDDVINACAGALVLAAQRAAQQVPFVVPLIIGSDGEFVGVTAAPQQVDATRAYYRWVANGGGG